MKNNVTFGIFTGILCILLFGVKLTGGKLHAVLGILLVILTLAHVMKYKKKLGYISFSLKLVDETLLAAMATMLVTGILMHPLKEIIVVMILHKLSSVIFCLGCIAHVLQHKKKRKERIHVS